MHKTVKEVLSVLDLVTKYDIPELLVQNLGDTRKVLFPFPLTDATRLEEETNQMRLHCTKYLRTAILQHLAGNIEQQDAVDEEEMADASKEDKKNQEISNHDLHAVFEVDNTVTDVYNTGKELSFVTFTKPAEANAAMETTLDNERMMDTISVDGG